MELMAFTHLWAISYFMFIYITVKHLTPIH